MEFCEINSNRRKRYQNQCTETKKKPGNTAHVAEDCSPGKNLSHLFVRCESVFRTLVRKHIQEPGVFTSIFPRLSRKKTSDKQFWLPLTLINFLSSFPFLSFLSINNESAILKTSQPNSNQLTTENNFIRFLDPLYFITTCGLLHFVAMFIINTQSYPARNRSQNLKSALKKVFF